MRRNIDIIDRRWFQNVLYREDVFGHQTTRVKCTIIGVVCE